MNKIFLPVICLIAMIAVAGCGPSAPATVPVSGTVLMDGKPLDGASVTFIAATGGTVAYGTTDSSGKFTLMTTIGETATPGAVPGSHKVGVAKSTNDGGTETAEAFSDPKKMAVKMGGAMTSNVKQTFIVAKRFNSPETSGIKVDVPAEGSQSLEIKVSAK